MHDYLRKMPQARRPVRRDDFLMETCRGRTVAHIGFVDHPFLDRRIGDGSWLHARLSGAASSIVGLDVDAEGVAWARSHGFEAYAVDAQSENAVAELGITAEVVVAGEVIEHLEAPGPFLRAMHRLIDPDGVLVVTTPNSYRLLNFFVPLTGNELVHPDHTAWHSPSTLRRLLTGAGWHVDQELFYREDLERTSRPAVMVANAIRALTSTRLLSRFADGLIAVCRPAQSAGSAAARR